MSSDNELSSSKLYEEAYDLMLNDQFDQALEIYSLAIEKCDKSDKSTLYNYYIGRSQAYLKLNKNQEALSDAEAAFALNNEDSRAYLKKGTALFNLKEFAKSLEALEQGLKLAQQNNEKKQNLFTDLIAKCQKEIPAPKQPEAEKQPAAENQTPVQAPAPAQPPKIKHEWYQTESNVTVCILAKNLSQDELKIDTQEHTLSVVSTNPDKHIDFHFNLLHSISAQDTAIKFMSTKVEIKLKKVEGVHWPTLEANAQQLDARRAEALKKPAYPTSSKNPKNWDKIVADVDAEEKDEKLEGDAALNKLFKQIYENGSDETRRAMNKSFSESGGTVLSTNWNEIGAQKVDIKAPDGMEWKKWDN